ncbi:MAG: hypothetical protein QM767_10060 [Anaeromyxobacter sp.]
MPQAFWGKKKGPFEVNGTRYAADCSGYVSAVYEAEEIRSAP